MKTKRLLVLFVALATFAATSSAFAQIGAFQNNYESNVVPTLDAQRQAAQSASRTNAANVQKAIVPKARQNDAPKTTAPKTRLVAVGIDKYSREKNGLNVLYGCVNDANAVCQAFDYAESSTLTDENATRDAILTALKNAANERCDRLIAYFGCHGVNARGKSFVCPSDARATDANLSDLNDPEKTPDVLKAGKEYRLIPLADVLDVLKKAKAKEVLVVFDACRSELNSRIVDVKGDFMRELLELGAKNNAFARPNRGSFAVLTSCSARQSASETFYDDLDRGIFTRVWLEGLTTGAADYAGLADGCVTLVESYNYAYSRTIKEAKKLGQTQTPERYFSNVANNFVLKKVADPIPPENETDLQFLARAGKILANLKWTSNDNRVGLEVLNCVLENCPNDVAARGSRAAVRRKLGDYAGALDDYNKIGEKFQLYAKREQRAQNDSELGEEKDGETRIREYDLLTVDRIEGDRFYVSEINNVSLERVGWIDRSDVGWSLAVNGANIASATTTQDVQTIRSDSGMIVPGLNAVTGPRPFVGTLGF